MTGPPNCGTENLAAPPRGSSCEMVVARSAVWRYPRRVQGTRAMRGRFKIAALFFTAEAVVSAMGSYSRRKCACRREAHDDPPRSGLRQGFAGQ